MAGHDSRNVGSADKIVLKNEYGGKQTTSYINYLVRKGEQTGLRQKASKTSIVDKQSGGYAHSTNKEVVSGGEIFKDRSTGRLGYKDEYKTTSTYRVGDKSVYIEHQLVERFRNINFGDSNSSSNNYNGSYGGGSYWSYGGSNNNNNGNYHGGSYNNNGEEYGESDIDDGEELEDYTHDTEELEEEEEEEEEDKEEGEEEEEDKDEEEEEDFGYEGSDGDYYSDGLDAENYDYDDDDDYCEFGTDYD